MGGVLRTVLLSDVGVWATSHQEAAVPCVCICLGIAWPNLPEPTPDSPRAPASTRVSSAAVSEHLLGSGCTPGIGVGKQE